MWGPPQNLGPFGLPVYWIQTHKVTDKYLENSYILKGSMFKTQKSFHCFYRTYQDLGDKLEYNFLSSKVQKVSLSILK